MQGKRIWESQFRLERMAPFLSTYAQATANQRRRTRAFAKRCCRTPGTRDIPPVCDRYYTASAGGPLKFSPSGSKRRDAGRPSKAIWSWVPRQWSGVEGFACEGTGVIRSGG